MSKARDIADLDFNSPDIDGGNIDGATIGGTTPAAGTFSQVNVDNITIDGNEIDVSSGSMTLDSASQIILDAAGGNFQFLKSGTEFARIFESGSDFYIYNPISDKDIKFYGNDGGTSFTALTLDMSAAGAASFNSTVTSTAFGSQLATTLFVQNVLKSSVASSAGAFIRMAVSGSDNPTYAFEDDTNTGMFTSGADTLNFSTAGTERLTIASDGAATFSSTGTFAGGNTNFDNDADVVTLNGSLHTRLLIDTSSTGGHQAALVLESNGNQSIIGNTGSNTAFAVAAGNLTLDVAGEIILDADQNGVVRINDAGSNFGALFKNGTTFTLKSELADYDMVFSGNDGGSTINALTLDMSAAGAASFNAGVTIDSTLLLSPDGSNDLIKSTGGVLYLKANELSIQDNSGNQKLAIDTNILLDTGGIIVLDADNAGVIQLKDGGNHYGSFFTSSDSFNIQSNVSDGDIIFKGNDGGSGFTALTLDMSAAGLATFNDDVVADAFLPTAAGAYASNHVGVHNSGVVLNAATSQTGYIMSAGSSVMSFSPTGGVLQLGGLTAANALDDYEEGTWTPATGPGSSQGYLFRSGYYTKVGRLVTAYFGLKHNGGTFTSGEAVITGLPFAVQTTGSFQEPMIILTTIGNAPTGVGGSGGSGALIPGEASFYLAGGESQARGRMFTSNADTVMSGNQIFDSDSFIKGTVVYYTS
jgi:hypothetical protein